MRSFKLISLIVPLFFSLQARAEIPDFHYIRFSRDFEASLEQSQDFVKSQSDSDTQLILKKALIGPEAFENSTSKSRSTPTDGQNSLLYGEIRQWLEGRYQTIGQGQAEHVRLMNQQFNYGGFNFSGFSWQKPFGGFGIYVNRTLSPDLFDVNRWIVMDTFTILIEASHFLGRLQEAGAVDMTQTEIAAFAGINFKRVYTTYHFANSFQDGLVADFRQLFLPFTEYSPERIVSLGAEKLIKREDTWTVAAGGLLQTPLWNGLSFYAGVLAEATHQSMLTVQRMQENSSSEYLRIGLKSKIQKRAGVSAGLQLDFFKLIKFTIMSYDLEYNSEKSKELTLSFEREDLDLLLDGREISQELGKVLKKQEVEIDYLEPYVTKLDESESEGSASKAMILLKGSLKKSNFEQIKVIKDQVSRTFIKSYSESIKLVQNFWSRIFSSVFFRLFNFATWITNDAALTRKLQIEYEATLPQSIDPKQMSVENTEQFSLAATLSYESARTHKWTDKSYRRDAENFMNRYTSLPGNLRTMVRNKELRAPLSVSTNIRMIGRDLDFFNSLDRSIVAAEFEYICQKKSSCIRKLKAPYEDYKKSLKESKKLELVHLKKLVSQILLEMHDLQSFYVLFGEGIFIHGTFRAYSSSGILFTTQHSQGQFNGLGIIDNFQRLNGTRQPASVWE